MSIVPAPASTQRPGKAGTRRRLLEAALALVADKGIAGASLAEIASRAGVTTGAVYSNFRSKEALLLALVEWQLQESSDDPAAFPPEDAPRKPLLQHLVDTAVASARYADTPQSRRLVVLQAELFLLAMRDRTVRNDLRAAEREAVRSLARVLDSLGEVPDPGPPPSLERLAKVFYASLQGLQQHRLLDPQNTPDDLFEWLVRAMLFTATGRKTQRGAASAARATSRRR